MNPGSKKASYFWVFLIVFISVLPRLYHIAEMPYDRHNFRQSATYAVVLNFFDDPNILRPRYYYRTIPENISRLTPGEVPFYEYTAFLAMKLWGNKIYIARILNILLATFSALFIVQIGTRLFNAKVGVLAGIVLSLLPLPLFYGRAITPDILALAAFLGALCGLLSAAKQRYLFFIICCGIAILTKPYYVLYTPLFILLKLNKEIFRSALKNIAHIVLYGATPFIFMILWIIWSTLALPKSALPENSITMLMHNNIGYFEFWRYSRWPVYFFTDFMPNTLLSPFGTILLWIGISVSFLGKGSSKKILFVWLLCALLITFVFSWATMNHDYYSLHWMPIVAIYIAIMVEKLWSIYEGSYARLFKLILICLPFLMVIYSYKSYVDVLRNYYSISTDFYDRKYFTEAEAIRRATSGEQVVGVFKHWNPYLLNMTKIPGIVYSIEPDRSCPTQEEIQSQLIYFISLQAPYVILQKQSGPNDVCLRKHIEEVLVKMCGEPILKQRVLDLYMCEVLSREKNMNNHSL